MRRALACGGSNPRRRLHEPAQARAQLAAEALYSDMLEYFRIPVLGLDGAACDLAPRRYPDPSAVSALLPALAERGPPAPAVPVEVATWVLPVPPDHLMTAAVEPVGPPHRLDARGCFPQAPWGLDARSLLVLSTKACFLFGSPIMNPTPPVTLIRESFHYSSHSCASFDSQLYLLLTKPFPRLTGTPRCPPCRCYLGRRRALRRPLLLRPQARRRRAPPRLRRPARR